MNLKKQTKKLLILLDECQARFETGTPPKKMKDQYFFQKMKEETAPNFVLFQEWEEDALEFVKDKHVNVHPHQIVSTKENMELILLHSYYLDARRKRYMELTKSSKFIFDQLLKDIERRTNNRGQMGDETTIN